MSPRPHGPETSTPSTLAPIRSFRLVMSHTFRPLETGSVLRTGASSLPESATGKNPGRVIDRGLPEGRPLLVARSGPRTARPRLLLGRGALLLPVGAHALFGDRPLVRDRVPVLGPGAVAA